MRALILLLLIHFNAQASGVFSLSQPMINTNLDATYTPTAGLYVYEPIYGRLYYQSWSGIKPNNWLSSDHSLMVELPSGVGVGVGPAYERSNKVNNFMLKGYVEVRVW